MRRPSLPAPLVFIPAIIGLGATATAAGAAAAAAWEPAALATADVRDLAFDAENPETLYLASHGGGLYVSHDRARSWAHVPSLPFRVLRAVAVDPVDGQRILVAGGGETLLHESGGLALSTDGGHTWRMAASDQRLATALDVEFDPHDPSRVYAPAGEHYWLSMDRGESWTRIGSPSSYKMTRLLLDPLQPGHAWFYDNVYKTVFRTADGGDTWASSQIPPGVSRDGLHLDPRVPGSLYGVTEDGGLILSEDGGLTWSLLSLGPGEPWLRDLVIRDDGVLFGLPYIPTFLGPLMTVRGILRRPRDGAVWLPLGEDSQRLARTDRLWFCPDDPEQIFAAAGNGGLLYSPDGGQSWEERNRGLNGGKVEYLATDPANPDHLWAVDGGSGVSGPGAPGVWRSEDAGRSWRHADLYAQPFREGPDGTLYSPSYVSAVYQDERSRVEASGLRRSRDGGLTWEDMSMSVLDVAGGGGRVFRHREAPLYWFQPEPASIVWAVVQSGLVASPDGGQTWIGGGLPDEARTAGVTLVTGLPDVPQAILVATPVGLYRTEGRDFERVSEISFEHVLRDPADGAVLYAASGDLRICHSSDRGQTWRPLALPPLGDLVDDPAAFAPVAGRLYAWTRSGLLFDAAPTDTRWHTLIDIPLVHGGMEVRAWTVAAGPALVVGTNGAGIFRVPLGPWTAVVETGGVTPDRAALAPVFPNPFNGAVTVPFRLAVAGHVQLAVYDMAGQRVRHLVDHRQEAGWHRVRWDGRDESGRAVASGAYLVQLRVGSKVFTERAALVR